MSLVQINYEWLAMTDWFLIKTRSRQELRAEMHLKNQGFLVFCPHFYCRNGRKEVLFPGYIFLRFKENQPAEKIRSTRGVSHFVKFGNRIAMVPDELIESIKLQEKSLDGSPVFNKGQLVEFACGPFKDYQAIYLCNQGEERSMVLLNLLNASREVVVETSSLRG